MLFPILQAPLPPSKVPYMADASSQLQFLPPYFISAIPSIPDAFSYFRFPTVHKIFFSDFILFIHPTPNLFHNCSSSDFQLFMQLPLFKVTWSCLENVWNMWKNGKIFIDLKKQIKLQNVSKKREYV